MAALATGRPCPGRSWRGNPRRNRLHLRRARYPDGGAASRAPQRRPHAPGGTTVIPSISFAGRVAVVTGASRGIGRELAGALANAGATVLAGVRDTDGDGGWTLDAGPRILPLRLDVRDIAGTREAVDKAVAEVGAID